MDSGHDARAAATVAAGRPAARLRCDPWFAGAHPAVCRDQVVPSRIRSDRNVGSRSKRGITVSPNKRMLSTEMS
jgi:hypothetical protein